jgi:hypothetical protein
MSADKMTNTAIIPVSVRSNLYTRVHAPVPEKVGAHVSKPKEEVILMALELNASLREYEDENAVAFAESRQMTSVARTVLSDHLPPKHDDDELLDDLDDDLDVELDDDEEDEDADDADEVDDEEEEADDADALEEIDAVEEDLEEDEISLDDLEEEEDEDEDDELLWDDEDEDEDDEDY